MCEKEEKKDQLCRREKRKKKRKNRACKKKGRRLKCIEYKKQKTEHVEEATGYLGEKKEGRTCRRE